VLKGGDMKIEEEVEVIHRLLHHETRIELLEERIQNLEKRIKNQKRKVKHGRRTKT
jgi:hypothetical protein